jgi:Fur family ferric uptake transcriptional regulator
MSAVRMTDMLRAMTDTAPTTEIHELVRARLADHSIRYTSGRHAVVTSIQMATGPLSAAELVEETSSGIPLSSLYRTLAILEETAVLKKHHGPQGLARYELAEWLTGHHHHVVCVACGAMEDVEIPHRDESALENIAGSLGDRAGFRVLGHVLEVEGVCQACDKVDGRRTLLRSTVREPQATVPSTLYS